MLIFYKKAMQNHLLHLFSLIQIFFKYKNLQSRNNTIYLKEKTCKSIFKEGK